MTFQRCVLLLVCASTISALVGCGGGSSPTPPPPPVIAVAFSTAPPASLQVDKTAPVIAAVSNDSSNAGVDWTCAPAGACGTFSAKHTASGGATTYTAPSSVPAGGKVTIKAASTADGTKSVSGTTTITAPSIAFNPAPPSSLDVKQQSPLTAVVTNDTSKAGVDWSCSPVNACGSFSAKHTASGTATNYTAPSSPVTAVVKATSTADPTQSVTANIVIYGVAISFYPQPTPSLLLSDTNPTPISAVVKHDFTNAGVDWACTGAANVCGALGAPHTNSGGANTYTLGGSNVAGVATITATSTADPTQVATAIITSTTTFGNATIGMTGGVNYVFQASGIDTHGRYQLTGVFTADGAGNITGGEQHYSNAVNVYIDQISATGSSYLIGADGRGTITLNTGDTNIGVGGVEILGLVVIDGTKGLITQFDTSATSSGTLDLQTPKSQLSGGYAFVTSGVNLATTPKPLGFGGVINVDGPGTISGKGSVADDIDNTTQNLNQTLTGTVASPDPLGKAVFTLKTTFTNQTVVLVAYVIDDTHARLIENDTYGVTAGTALGQGASTGTFKNSSFKTTVVFETLGQSTPGPTVYAGLFATDGAGNIKSGGVGDENAGGTYITGTLAGTYAVDSSGTGRVTTSLIFNGSPGPSWMLYLTGDASTPALILQVDKAPIETAGAAYTQATPGAYTAGSFNLNYAMNFVAFPTGQEDDGTGQVTADGISALAGTMDTNYDFAPTTGEALTGTFTADPSGRFQPSTLTEGTVFGPANVVFYVVDSTRVVFIEIDAQPALGVFRLQEQ